MFKAKMAMQKRQPSTRWSEAKSRWHGLFKAKIAMQKRQPATRWHGLFKAKMAMQKAPARNEMERSESGGGLQPGCHRCTRHHGQISHGCYKGFCGHKSFLKNRVAPQDGMACSKPKWTCKSASPQRDGVLTRIPLQVLAGYRLENN